MLGQVSADDILRPLVVLSLMQQGIDRVQLTAKVLPVSTASHTRVLVSMPFYPKAVCVCRYCVCVHMCAHTPVPEASYIGIIIRHSVLPPNVPAVITLVTVLSTLTSGKLDN